MAKVKKKKVEKKLRPYQVEQKKRRDAKVR